MPLSNNDKIKPSRERKRAQAAMALARVPYKDIATATGVKSKPGPEYERRQRQAVYISLQRPGGQEALREMSAKMYDQDKIRRIINDVLDAIKPGKVNGPQARIIEIAAKTEAMLTDRNLNENRNIDVTDVEDKRRIAAQALRMLEQAEQAGTSLAQMGQVEALTPKPQHDEGLDSVAQAYEDKTVTPDTV